MATDSLVCPHLEWTPSVICPPSYLEDMVGECSPSLHQLIPVPQGLESVVERADRKAWDQKSPDCIHYQIEWRVELNNQVVEGYKTRPHSAT